MADEPAVKPPTGASPPPASPASPEPAKAQRAQQGAQGNGSDAGAAPAPSVLEKLREKRDELSEDRYLTLEIPGYGGWLLARYQAVGYRELRKARKKQIKRSGADPEDEIRFAASALVRACDSMLVRTEEDGEPVELHTTVAEFGEDPVRYDARLAKAVGIDDTVSSASQVIRLVFKNTYALANHYDEYDQWLASNETDKDF